MADEIKLVTFEGSNVAPVNDALMWDAAIGDSGVIYGCETTLKNASTLHIDAGYGVICGRHFQIFESDIPVTLSSSGDLLGRLYAHMDLSDSSEPITLEIETAASLTPEEQDANINIINGVWDMNLATFAVNALTISNLQNVFSTVAGGGAGLIAGTETGATASQAYVAGQYIIWGGRLWEVIAAIAQGDAFVLGTNLSASSTTVGNELTELNSRLTEFEEGYGLNTKCIVKGLAFFHAAVPTSYVHPYMMCCDNDGSYELIHPADSPLESINTAYSTCLSKMTFISSATFTTLSSHSLAAYNCNIVIAKDGYYTYDLGSNTISREPTLLTAGTTLSCTIGYNGGDFRYIVYLGIVVPA